MVDILTLMKFYPDPPQGTILHRFEDGRDDILLLPCEDGKWHPSDAQYGGLYDSLDALKARLAERGPE